jgi:hypothetical protein
MARMVIPLRVMLNARAVSSARSTLACGVWDARPCNGLDMTMRASALARTPY